jgi:hypothetical protein
MRRLTFAVLALGCLALGLVTFLGPNASPISARLLAAPPDIERPCTQACSFGDPDETDKDDHFTYCHVDHGGEGHVNCSDASSINQHLANHHDDFCINDEAALADCTGKKGE